MPVVVPARGGQISPSRLSASTPAGVTLAVTLVRAPIVALAPPSPPLDLPVNGLS